MPYNNLEAELRRKHISRAKFAKLLGVSSNTISRRMNGSTRWTIDEIKKIMSDVFENQQSFNYLFKEV